MSVGSNQTNNVNLGTYVVGQVTGNMPLTGSATYNGMMIGNVQNGNNAYVGTGTYAMDWSFRNRGGTFGATFDGTNYGGLVGGTGGANFGGVFGSLNGRAGVLAGSFFGPQAQNQGGSFSIGNNLTAYKASGIFAGQR
jgi:hypothetical protein